MKTEQDIDWEECAKEFLRLHNWKEEDDGLWSHPAFVLMEMPVESEGSYLQYVEFSYGEAWKWYKAQVKTVLILSKEFKE